MRPALAALAAAVLSTPACAPASPAEPSQAVVHRVVDGDTLDVTWAGSGVERVRLLGIDTPESVIPGEPPECFGPEAASRLAQLLPPGTAIRLERDVEARDHYGRLLAYVYRSDVMVNRQLAAEGLAEALAIPPNTAWTDEIAEAARRARQTRTGLWGACGE